MKLSKKEQKEIAENHINELFDLAKKTFSSEKSLSDRYIKLALEMRNKYKIKLTKEQKAHFCKSCHCFLMPGANSKVRIKNKAVLLHCDKCGFIRRLTVGISTQLKK